MHTSLEDPPATDTGPPPAGDRPIAARAPWRRAVVGGWSFARGTVAVTGVTFPSALETAAPAGVDLHIVNLVNTAGRPVVLTDPGFAPDREGFTLAVCAAEPGPFLAEVRYSHAGDGAVADLGAVSPQPEGEPPA